MSEAGDRRKTRSYVPITAPRPKAAGAAISSQRLPAQTEPPENASSGTAPQMPMRPPYPPRPLQTPPGVTESTTRHLIQSGSSTRIINNPDQTKRLDPKSISIRAPSGNLGLRSSASLAIGCKQCSKPLPMELLNRLPAQGRSGQMLICPACQIFNKEKVRQQRNRLICFAVGAGVLVAALGAVFPQTAMFMLAALGLGAIALGLVGFTWERVTRLVMVAGGLAATLAGLAVLWTLQDRAADLEAKKDVQHRAAKITEFLEQGKFLEAHEACERLQIEVREHNVRFGSNEIREIVAAVRGEVDHWVESHYEGLTADGRQLLLGLMRLFPDAQGIKGQRVRSLQVSGGQVSLTMLVPQVALSAPGTARASGDPRANEARIILVNIFDGIPGIEEIRLTLLAQDENGDSDAGTYIVKKDQAVSLRMGELARSEQARPK